LIVAAVGSTLLVKNLRDKLIYWNYQKLYTACTVIFILIVMTLATAGLASDSFNPFLYFRF
ncbi:MAG: MBOAT family protein, partial [Eubacterium sp.]|nr:MBOAT family protein [Eubacterium sp.]